VRFVDAQGGEETMAKMILEIIEPNFRAILHGCISDAKAQDYSLLKREIERQLDRVNYRFAGIEIDRGGKLTEIRVSSYVGDVNTPTRTYVYVRRPDGFQLAGTR
jgi:hypothetical protein